LLGKAHPYLPTGVESIEKAMMTDIGINSIEELFKDIPDAVRLKRKLKLPDAMSEFEVRQRIAKLLEKNVSGQDMPIFLGGGVWPHYVPAVVEEIVNRSEFLTTYTPYQAEASQGILQTFFEYQSMICELTGMDIANCSLYDWASAVGEAARASVRVNHRSEIIYPHYIHPERLRTLKTYTEPADIKTVEVEQDKKTGQMILDDLKKKVTDKTAAVYIENPSYLGFLEEGVDEISDLTHKNESMLIVGVDPISLGILKPPGEYGADIVVGEGQPLGSPVNYGGPLIGIYACNGDKLLRQMPGRVIGMTCTTDGKQTAYCMTLSTREQHIRREKATSNICSNEALLTVAASVYLSLLGPVGLKDLCTTIMTNSHYAMKKLSQIRGVNAPGFEASHFKEFTVNFDKTKKKAKEVHKGLIKQGVHGGKIVKNEFPELGESALYCVTEVHSKSDIDKLADALRKVVRG
jgi:glycine dehydrogenase subunit 1